MLTRLRDDYYGSVRETQSCDSRRVGQTNRRVAQRGHHLWPGSLPDQAAVFSERDIFDIEQLIFDAPMSSFQG